MHRLSTAEGPSDPAGDAYDAVVVGAGVAGLVCGCALAGAGFRVLIVEKEPRPGGCCVSFHRGEFTFDSGVTSLSGCGPGGSLHRILGRLGMAERVKLIRQNPREVISSPSFEVPLFPDRERAFARLAETFGHEARGLARFESYLFAGGDSEGGDEAASRGVRPFAAVLEECFEDRGLRALFAILLGNLGVAASRMPAGAAGALFRDFIFDGGYYPEGGVGAFPKALAARFRELGGEALFSRRVERIDIRGRRAVAVALDNGSVVGADAVVSASDAATVLLDMVGEEFIGGAYARALRAMRPSVSAFIVYLGLDRRLNRLCGRSRSFLHLFHHDVEGMFRRIGGADFQARDDYVYCICPSTDDPGLAPPGGESVCLFALAPFGEEGYWEANRERIADRMTARAEALIPGLTRHVALRETATPRTFRRYTGNADGAIYGWASIAGQTGRRRLARETPIENLYLAGHWTQPGPGVAMAARSGYLTAKRIMFDG